MENLFASAIRNGSMDPAGGMIQFFTKGTGARRNELQWNTLTGENGNTPWSTV